MPIRTAGITDVNILAAIRDIEQRLNDLEGKPRENPLVSPEDVTSLRDDLALLRQNTNPESFNVMVGQGTLHKVGYVPDPGGTTLFTDRVLHASGDWVSPLNGHLKLVPPASCGTSSAQAIANLHGSLAVDSAISAESIHARRFIFQEAHGGTLVNPNGITATINVIAWIAPYPCTVLSVKGYRVGGTSASINARLNGASDHLSSALSLSSTDTWLDGGAVQNTGYVSGDKLEIMLTAVGGSPTQIGIQVTFVRA